MPELVEFSVSPIEYADAQGNRLDVSRYTYKPYPKMLYRADGATKIVQDADEHRKAGKEWNDIPTKKRIWDTRQIDIGFSIGDHHLAFLQSEGFELKTLDEAKAFFDGLNDAAKEAFLTDAANWIPPEPQKRGPGRPPKDAA
jgi:hypothetical protein